MRSVPFARYRPILRTPLRPVRGTVAALTCALLLGVPASTVGAGGLPGGLGVPEYQVVAGINCFRSQYGLVPLRVSTALGSSTHEHSTDMAGRRYYGHNTLYGWAWNARIKRYLRARVVGETLDLLYGAATADEPSRVVNDWIQSPPHRAVLLTRSLRRVGVARAAIGDGGPAFFTADFAS